MYELIFDHEAIKFLEKLEKDISKRIFVKLQSAKSNPFHFFQALEGRKDFKLRVGHYRVLADIDVKNKRIEITRIGHRKNIYKNI
jgi:mRNA interferase RelE/StbE